MAIDLDKLQDSSHLLEMLIQMEDVLDSLDVYCFPGWISGEVIEGPIIRRHWVSMSLLYPYVKMPDPRAALRLLKHGVMVEFNRMTRAADEKPEDTVAAEMQATGKPPKVKASEEKDWLIKLTFPRRLLDQIAAADLDAYEDDVEVEDVEDAQDAGLNDTTAYQTEETAPGDEEMPEAGNQNGPEDNNGFPT